MRHELAIIMGWALCAGVAIPASAQTAMVDHERPLATLKNSAQVDGSQILLSDLFDVVGPHAQDVVAAAPPPGLATVFNASTLVSMAQDHGVAWRPPTPFTTIRVERSSVEIGNDEIAAKLASALGIEEPERRIVFDNGIKLFTPTGATPRIDLYHVNFDKELSRFTAEVRVTTDGASAQSVRVSGHVQTLVELAVLNRTVMPGDVIQPADVTTTWIRAELAPGGGVTSAQDLLGKTPRRPLCAGQPLRQVDVEVPIIIKRNDLVLIVLESPGLSLTAQGKAMENGGQGAVIRVTNVQSNRTVDAVVLGSGRVQVQAPMQASF